MVKAKKTEAVEDVAESAPTEVQPQYLTFAEVMRIHNQHKAEGLIPADPQPERKKRPKTKRF